MKTLLRNGFPEYLIDLVNDKINKAMENILLQFSKQVDNFGLVFCKWASF